MKKKLLSKWRKFVRLPAWLRWLIIMSVSVMPVLIEMEVLGDKWSSIVEFLSKLLVLS